jgi:hypothetical protein
VRKVEQSFDWVKMQRKRSLKNDLYILGGCGVVAAVCYLGFA